MRTDHVQYFFHEYWWAPDVLLADTKVEQTRDEAWATRPPRPSFRVHSSHSIHFLGKYVEGRLKPELRLGDSQPLLKFAGRDLFLVTPHKFMIKYVLTKKLCPRN